MYADLHRHLDGSLRPQTLRKLAEATGIELPSHIPFHAGMSLQDALARFEITLSVLQHPDAVQRIASEMCEDAESHHVTTLEIRFAPQLHQGAPMEAIVDAVLEGIDGRAGLILCTLYGDAPSIPKTLVEIARTRPGVVGLDLAGGPTPNHTYRMEDYAESFRQAAELGLGRTVHAGEGRPPSEIRRAIEVLGATRIGHGTTLLDDPTVVDLVLERGVTIEACPTSNVHTGVIPSVEAHPLPRWLELGVSACVCTDNTLFSEVTSPEEHDRVSRIPGMTPERLERVIAAGHAARFVRA